MRWVPWVLLAVEVVFIVWAIRRWLMGEWRRSLRHGLSTHAAYPALIAGEPGGAEDFLQVVWEERQAARELGTLPLLVQMSPEMFDAIIRVANDPRILTGPNPMLFGMPVQEVEGLERPRVVTAGLMENEARIMREALAGTGIGEVAEMLEEFWRVVGIDARMAAERTIATYVDLRPPGYGSVGEHEVVPVRLTECWRDRCRNEVEEYDPVGLCEPCTLDMADRMKP